MNEVRVTISGSPLTLAVHDNERKIGSRYDHLAADLIFQRPDEFQTDELLLFFDNGETKFAPVALGSERDPLYKLDLRATPRLS